MGEPLTPEEALTEAEVETVRRHIIHETASFGNQTVRALLATLDAARAAPPPVDRDRLGGRWSGADHPPSPDPVAGLRERIIETVRRYGIDSPSLPYQLDALLDSPKLDALTREERDHLRTIEERDDAIEWADRLAYALGGPDIGEHSNLNNPWQNALDAPKSDGLDVAWAEAEALTKGGGWLVEFGRRDTIEPMLNPRTGYPVKFPGHYFAAASREFSSEEGPTEYGDTPATALRALAARLREREADQRADIAQAGSGGPDFTPKDWP